MLCLHANIAQPVGLRKLAVIVVFVGKSISVAPVL